MAEGGGCYQCGLTILPFRGDASKKFTTVKTVRQISDGTNISVNYALLNGQDQWRIFDVIIEGVSYVRNFRTEADAEIKKTSLDDLIDRLEAESIEGDAK
jgi:phospholipid transport system substrate-binding protein